MKRYPNYFGFSVSHTSRAPRPGEVDGVHYHFSSLDEIEAGIAKGEFIEHATVHTNKYGTTYAAVRSVQNQGKICILDIDIQGVQSVKKSNLDCKYLFVMPPSVEELEKRLRGRGTEKEEKIQIRLKNALTEMEYGRSPGNFDAIITNDRLGDSVHKLVDLVSEWYPSFDFSKPAMDGSD